MYLILFRKFKALCMRHKTLKLFILLTLSIGLFVAVITYFEKITPWQSLYFSIVTATTIGYGDISPKTIPGQFAVMVFIFVALALIGEAVTSFASTISDTLNKKHRGLMRMKTNVDLLIIGYPSRAKVEGIVDEFIRASEDKVDIVCMNNKLEVAPSWMVEKGITFIRGSAAVKAVLERANVANTNTVIVLANEPENVESDAHTAAAIIMCEQINPDIRTIAERVSPDKDLFNVCHCDCVVPISRANELAQEAVHPGTISFITDLTDSTTAFSQRNIILMPEIIRTMHDGIHSDCVLWKDIVMYFLNTNMSAIGYSEDGVTFTFNPIASTRIYLGSYIKCIVNNEN